MYNRYIPQPDGSFRRDRVQEQRKDSPPPILPRQEQSVQEPVHEAESSPCRNCVHNQPPRRPVPPRPKKNTPPVGIGSFLKGLLPSDFDTEDLLIVLLLLLMAGENHEDQNSALLTLVLYLFM